MIQKPGALLFLDLRSAFYTVIREIVVHGRDGSAALACRWDAFRACTALRLHNARPVARSFARSSAPRPMSNCHLGVNHQ